MSGWGTDGVDEHLRGWMGLMGADGVEPYLLESSYNGLCEGVDKGVDGVLTGWMGC